MSNLKIEESFEVNAPVERVWDFLKDPAQVVTCLPGAALDEVIDDRNYAGNVKVKVGPVTVAYKGIATLKEVDEEKRQVLIHGEGKEKAGGGNVAMDMTGNVEPTDGGAKVSFVADVKLAGKIVRFGRGMIEGVSDQLFKQFVDKAETFWSSRSRKRRPPMKVRRMPMQAVRWRPPKSPPCLKNRSRRPSMVFRSCSR